VDVYVTVGDLAVAGQFHGWGVLRDDVRTGRRLAGMLLMAQAFDRPMSDTMERHPEPLFRREPSQGLA